MEKRFRLGVIGGGVMARAIVGGAVKSGFLSAEEIAVSAPSEGTRNCFSEYGIYSCFDNRSVAERSDFLLFAVKPQMFAEVAEGLKSASLPVLLSIMAGKTTASIRNYLENPTIKIARIMPNLPCAVGEGMSGVCTAGLSDGEREFVMGLFSSVGRAEEVREELIDAVTGISGSGPAYVYLFLQSLVEAGVRQGLSESQARAFALQTLKGGVKMAECNPDQSFTDLIASVSSKGGTTLAALGSFEKDAFGESVSRAVSAAVRRAEELSE